MESAGLIGKMNSSQHCFRGNASGVSQSRGGGGEGLLKWRPAGLQHLNHEVFRETLNYLSACFTNVCLVSIFCRWWHKLS